MHGIDIQEKNIETGLFQFIYPFSIENGLELKILSFLKENDFTFFLLDHLEKEKAYYGDFTVSHREIEAYFLSFTNKVLFPHSEHQKGLKRYSKALNLNGQLKTDLVCIPFQIPSIDVILCPYELGFLTIRTQLKESMELSHALEFAGRFRKLEPRNDRDKETQIIFKGKEYDQVNDFVYNGLFEGLPNFFEDIQSKGSYFETFPFFEDERMYVQSLLIVKEEADIDLADVYRAGSLCGITPEGKPFISANNEEYIRDYLMENGYHRWAPSTYFVMEEHLFTCLTKENAKRVSELSSQLYGEFYYGILLNLFHKIVLLKLGHEYAELNIEKNTANMEKLIYSINSFTANYFSLELISQSPSREVFFLLRKKFNIELLYKEAKRTLNSLFKYQENVNAKKESLLLLLLTLYSVIGQMFGMSLVTGDFIGRIKWGHVLKYNPVEYFALIVAASGIIISIFLGIQNIRDWLLDRRVRKKWIRQTVMSSTKEKE